jgi:gliding motility-associated-like protein
MKTFFLGFIFCIVFLSYTDFKAQQKFQITDSLKGFDEARFLKTSIADGLSGPQLSIELAIAKKEFIYAKYYQDKSPNLSFKSSAATIVQPSCTNMDFETGTFFGWIGATGTSTNSVSMGGCCPTVGAVNSAVINSTGFDPAVGGTTLPLTSPFGGSKIARVNNVATGSKVDRIEQSFNVTSSNAIFQIAFAAVLNSAGAHSCSQQPYVNISLIDSAGNTLACPFLSFSAPSTLCSSADPSWITFGAGHYKPWSIQTLDLSPYIGSFVTIRFTVGDCTQSGHYGYAYFDCKCLPLEISLNSTIFDATPTTPINVSTCGAISALVIAPTGLGPYLWQGPSGSGVSSITTQSISTSTPGTYTLTMSPAGACYGPTVKYVILNVSPNPIVSNLTAQASCTNAAGSGTINVTSGVPPYTYSWTPAASTTSLGLGLSPGVNYTVQVIDAFGCRNTTTVSILSFSNAPTYTVIPTTANLSCLISTITVSAFTGANTTAVWTNTSTSSFVATTAGNYSVVLTNTLSLCTATVPVTITSNTVGPIATFSVACNSGTIGLNASSTAGIALGWLAPTLPFASPVSNPGTSTASGIFTLTATNLSSGCKTTYTVQSTIPNLSVTVTPQLTLTCIPSSLQGTSTSSLAGVVFTWDNGVSSGSANPYAITSGGTYTVSASFPGGCATKTIITIATNTLTNVNISSVSSIIPCSTNSLTLNASSSLGGPYTYTWAPSLSAGSSYVASSPGVYTVAATNAANGCVAIATKSVTREAVNASFIANPYQGFMPLLVTFTNSSINTPSNSVVYSWNFGNGNPIITTIGPLLSPSTVYSNQGTYTVVLTATKGFCVDTMTRIIIVDVVSDIKVPNVITPNGDGKNDIFYLDLLNVNEISMTIFDRWGLIIYESSDISKISWDGKNKSGSLVSDGTYFYIINASGLDNKPHKLNGTISVFK